MAFDSNIDGRNISHRLFTAYNWGVSGLEIPDVEMRYVTTNALFQNTAYPPEIVFSSLDDLPQVQVRQAVEIMETYNTHGKRQQLQLENLDPVRIVQPDLPDMRGRTGSQIDLLITSEPAPPERSTTGRNLNLTDRIESREQRGLEQSKVTTVSESTAGESKSKPKLNIVI